MPAVRAGGAGVCACVRRLRECYDRPVDNRDPVRVVMLVCVTLELTEGVPKE